jgi:hypothetical protein
MDVQATAYPHPWESRSMGCWSCSSCTPVWSRLYNVHHRHHQHDRGASFSQLLYRFLSRPKWRGNDTVILVRNPMSFALGYWYVCREFEPRLAYAIFAHQADAINNQHGLSKCIHRNPLSLGWHRSLHSWFLSMDKWMRKASIHKYYRYVKEMAVAGLTH